MLCIGTTVFRRYHTLQAARMGRIARRIYYAANEEEEEEDIPIPENSIEQYSK